MDGPEPGWFAIDVNFLHGTHWPTASGEAGWVDIPIDGWDYEYSRNLRPVASVGYSICIYHITLDEANRLRQELGLPEVVGNDGDFPGPVGGDGVVHPGAKNAESGRRCGGA